jgi:DNA-binding MarR family transcriptional regulator
LFAFAWPGADDRFTGRALISISGICHFHEVGICHYLVNGGDKNYFCGQVGGTIRRQGVVMTKATLPGLTLCNNATLRRAGRKLGRFYDDVLAPSGLKGTQYGLLYQIHIGSEPAMGAIAEALIMDLSALGHTLKPLIRDGYVEAFADKDDRRVKRVRLTPQGGLKLNEATKLWTIAQQRFEAMVGKDQAAKLRAALDAIAALDFDMPPAR